MRLLHFIPCLGLSGAEKQLSMLGAALSRRGDDCHVAFLTDHPQDAYNRGHLEDAGATLHRVAGSSPYDPRVLWSARRLIRRIRPDIVQTWLAMMDIVVGLALRGTDVPWVVSERSTPTLVDPSPKMRVRERIVPWCDAVVANSTGGADAWRARLRPSVPCRVIPNSLDVSAIQAAGPGDLTELGFPHDVPFVLYTGRLLPFKNVDVLLESLATVISETDACAAIIGEGPERSRIQTAIRERGLQTRLVAPGFIPNPWPWLLRADVFLSLSRTEGMPNTVMEAVASGCPVVLSDIRPHRALLDSRDACFVPSTDPHAAARAIIDLIRDSGSERKRAERAKRSAARWSVDTAVDEYRALYHELLSSRRARHSPDCPPAPVDPRVGGAGR